MKKLKRSKSRRSKEGSEIQRPEEIIDFLEKLDQAYQSQQNNPNPPYSYDAETNQIKLPLHIKQELERLCQQGKKVEACRRVTKLTGAGLRLSKDYVDALEFKKG
jgi:ribosomal protein L7/L12